MVYFLNALKSKGVSGPRNWNYAVDICLFMNNHVLMKLGMWIKFWEMGIICLGTLSFSSCDVLVICLTDLEWRAMWSQNSKLTHLMKPQSWHLSFFSGKLSILGSKFVFQWWEYFSIDGILLASTIIDCSNYITAQVELCAKLSPSHSNYPPCLRLLHRYTDFYFCSQPT